MDAALSVELAGLAALGDLCCPADAAGRSAAADILDDDPGVALDGLAALSALFDEIEDCPLEYNAFSDFQVALCTH